MGLISGDKHRCKGNGRLSFGYSSKVSESCKKALFKFIEFEAIELSPESMAAIVSIDRTLLDT